MGSATQNDPGTKPEAFRTMTGLNGHQFRHTFCEDSPLFFFSFFFSFFLIDGISLHEEQPSEEKWRRYIYICTVARSEVVSVTPSVKKAEYGL